jgi:hypothetical protein
MPRERDDEANTDAAASVLLMLSRSWASVWSSITDDPYITASNIASIYPPWLENRKGNSRPERYGSYMVFLSGKSTRMTSIMMCIH